jgi:hypothetical protein
LDRESREHPELLRRVHLTTPSGWPNSSHWVDPRQLRPAGRNPGITPLCGLFENSVPVAPLPFVDVFSLLNGNAEQNANWSSGSSFLRPLSIVPPRLARLGAKLEW